MHLHLNMLAGERCDSAGSCSAAELRRCTGNVGMAWVIICGAERIPTHYAQLCTHVYVYTAIYIYVYRYIYIYIYVYTHKYTCLQHIHIIERPDGRCRRSGPHPFPTRPRLRPHKAIVRRQPVLTIDVLEGSRRGPLGSLRGPLGRPEAQGRSGVSGRGSRWSMRGLGDVWTKP